MLRAVARSEDLNRVSLAHLKAFLSGALRYARRQEIGEGGSVGGYRKGDTSGQADVRICQRAGAGNQVIPLPFGFGHLLRPRGVR